MRSGRLLAVAACLATLGVFTLNGIVRADVAKAARNFLQVDRGLTQVGGGQIWISRHEQQLRQRLGSLRDLESTIQATQRELDERVVANQRRWRTEGPRIAKLEAALIKLPTSDPQRQRMEAEVAVLRRRTVDPKRLGGQHDVKARLIALINHRTEMTLTILWVRDHHLRLSDEYRKLSEDAKVATALSRLGDRQRLGPERDYAKQAARYERLVLTPWTPLYRHGGQLRFSAILNDQTPVTFSWSGEGSPTMITAAMAEAAGLTVPADATVVSHTTEQRRVPARQIHVKRLRIGGIVLRNVPVLVLPPEAEDLGARLGRDALGSVTAVAQPERLRLSLGES